VSAAARTIAAVAIRRAACALVALILPVGLAAQTRSAERFPHARHAKLFPTCAGCHAGIIAGDAARAFPPATSCASCHDGTIKPRVSWAAPEPRGLGLIAFSHPAHLGSAKDVTCVGCHATDTTAWMQVARPVPETCVGCHTHSAPSHLDDANTCTTCHRPLTAAVGLTDAHVLELPRPESHSRPTWSELHGRLAVAPTANCATCHARESCARCHVNASRLDPIRALGSDARVARTVAGRAPSYPTPASHRSTNFTLTHAAAARTSTATCATCHARASCETCHTGPGAAAVLKLLPDESEAAAAGVHLRRAPAPPTAAPAILAALQSTARPHVQDTVTRRVLVHIRGFERSHGPSAAAGELNCSGCHAQSFCSTCHAGERVTRTYHKPNFLSTHAPQAYGREVDCSACHSAQAFCRSCHLQSGIAPRTSTARTPTFHNAEPLWLLKHGRAARQNLESCATCHQQTYCMQCHSGVGARINPHGPGFDASRMSSRNSEVCLRCHLTKPPGQ